MQIAHVEVQLVNHYTTDSPLSIGVQDLTIGVPDLTVRVPILTIKAQALI